MKISFIIVLHKTKDWLITLYLPQFTWNRLRQVRIYIFFIYFNRVELSLRHATYFINYNIFSRFILFFSTSYGSLLYDKNLDWEINIKQISKLDWQKEKEEIFIFAYFLTIFLISLQYLTIFGNFIEIFVFFLFF
jgi:hypothetical protein